MRGCKDVTATFTVTTGTNNSNFERILLHMNYSLHICFLKNQILSQMSRLVSQELYFLFAM